MDSPSMWVAHGFPLGRGPTCPLLHGSPAAAWPLVLWTSVAFRTPASAYVLPGRDRQRAIRGYTWGPRGPFVKVPRKHNFPEACFWRIWRNLEETIPQTELASEGVLADLVTMFLGSLRLGRPTPPAATGGRRRDPVIHFWAPAGPGRFWEGKWGLGKHGFVEEWFRKWRLWDFP